MAGDLHDFTAFVTQDTRDIEAGHPA